MSNTEPTYTLVIEALYSDGRYRKQTIAGLLLEEIEKFIPLFEAMKTRSPHCNWEDKSRASFVNYHPYPEHIQLTREFKRLISDIGLSIRHFENVTYYQTPVEIRLL